LRGVLEWANQFMHTLNKGRQQQGKRLDRQVQEIAFQIRDSELALSTLYFETFLNKKRGECSVSIKIYGK